MSSGQEESGSPASPTSFVFGPDSPLDPYSTNSGSDYQPDTTDSSSSADDSVLYSPTFHRPSILTKAKKKLFSAASVLPHAMTSGAICCDESSDLSSLSQSGSIALDNDNSSRSTASSLARPSNTAAASISLASVRKAKKNLFSAASVLPHTITSGTVCSDESSNISSSSQFGSTASGNRRRSTTSSSLSRPSDTAAAGASMSSVSISRPEGEKVAAMLKRQGNSYNMTVTRTLHSGNYSVTFTAASTTAGKKPEEQTAFLTTLAADKFHTCKSVVTGVVPVVVKRASFSDSLVVSVAANFCLWSGNLAGTAINTEGTIVVPMLYTKAQPGDAGKSKRHCCLFCRKLVTAIGRHVLMVHKTEERVKAVALLPVNSKERHQFLDDIRKEGDKAHNTSVLPEKRIPLKIPTKTSVADMVTCPRCSSVLARRTYFKHHIKCTGRKTNLAVKEKCLQEVTNYEESQRRMESTEWDALTEELLGNLRHDEVTSTIRNDRCIMLMAKRYALKYRSEPHHFKNGRQHLRLAANILLKSKTRDPSIRNYYDLLKNDKYELLMTVIDEDIMQYQPESRTYDKPSYSNVIRLVLNELDAAVRTEMSLSGISNTDPIYQDLDQFRFLHDKEFGHRITKTANTTTKRRHMRRKIELPTTKDIVTFTKFLQKVGEVNYDRLVKDGFVFSAWQALNAAILLKLMIFNRRRPGEVGRARLEDWNVRSAISEQDKKHMNRLDVITADTYIRVQILGKRDRLLPLLIKVSEEKWIEKIIEFRSAAGVAEENPYLFAKYSADGHFMLNPLIRKYANLCPNLDFPNRFRGTLLRKQVATQAQYLNLTEAELRMVADGMGHDLSVHMQVYRQPELNNDILLLAKYFEFVGDSNLAAHKGKSIEELKEVLDKDGVTMLEHDDSSDDDDLCSGDGNHIEPILSVENGELENCEGRGATDHHMEEVPCDREKKRKDSFSLMDDKGNKKFRFESQKKPPITDRPGLLPVPTVLLERLPISASEKKEDRSEKTFTKTCSRQRLPPATTERRPPKTPPRRSKLDIAKACFNTPTGKGRRAKLSYNRTQRDLMFHAFGRRLLKGSLVTPAECQEFIENHPQVFVNMRDRNVSAMYSYIQFRRNTIRRQLGPPAQEI